MEHGDARQSATLDAAALANPCKPMEKATISSGKWWPCLAYGGLGTPERSERALISKDVNVRNTSLYPHLYPHHHFVRSDDPAWTDHTWAFSFRYHHQNTGDTGDKPKKFANSLSPLKKSVPGRTGDKHPSYRGHRGQTTGVRRFSPWRPLPLQPRTRRQTDPLEASDA